jgi:hypothetical protein
MFRESALSPQYIFLAFEYERAAFGTVSASKHNAESRETPIYGESNRFLPIMKRIMVVLLPYG